MKTIGEIEYSPISDLSREYVQQIGLFPDFDGFSSEDFLSGNFMNFDFRLHEIYLTQTVESNYVDKDGNSRTTRKSVPIFRGFLAILKLRRRIPTKILITNAGGYGSFFKTSIRLIQEFSESNFENPLGRLRGLLEEQSLNSQNCAEMQEVELEIPYFENNFTVYSFDPIETKKLLTYEFMESYANNFLYGLQIEEDVCVFPIPSDKSFFEMADLHEPDYVNDIILIRRQFANVIQSVEHLRNTLDL